MSYFNEKMIYGDDGITFVNIWNHSEHYTWDEIVVEDTFESSHSIGNCPVRVVYIRYKNARGRMTRVRYQVNDYSGIQQFLSFYEQMQRRQYNEGIFYERFTTGGFILGDEGIPSRCIDRDRWKLLRC